MLQLGDSRVYISKIRGLIGQGANKAPLELVIGLNYKDAPYSLNRMRLTLKGSNIIDT